MSETAGKNWGLLAKSVYEAVNKKENLFDTSFMRYAVRSMYASLFLTMGTSAGLITAQAANAAIPGSGRFWFSFLFGWTLVLIVYMDGELATSNMMYMTYGSLSKWLKPNKALGILMTSALFNLIGAFIFGYLVTRGSMFQNLPMDHYLYAALEGKMAKSAAQVFFEGIFANLFVNTAITISTRMVNADGRAWGIVFTIFMFAFTGFEHVIADFVVVALALFAHGGLWGPVTIIGILKLFFFAFLGNYVGGGLLIGAVYQFMNKGQKVYLD